MKGHFLLYILLAFLFLPNVFAGTYESAHFVIYSDLDPRYVDFIQANAEAYYQQMEQSYFRTGGPTRIKIYYSERQADTQELFNKHGLSGKAHYGRYVPGVPAIYTHRLMDDGGASGWGTLFHEITHHFIDLNYSSAPVWFEEGLACLLGEQTRIVKGKLSVGHPNPWREHALRKMIENGEKIDVKQLVSLSGRQFHQRRENYHPTRALFYWLYDSGHLETYLQNVQKRGYGPLVLEETAGKRLDLMSIELLSFIEKDCYAGAYLYEGLRAKNKARKEQLLLNALQLKPDYKAAHRQLAWCYYRGDDSQKAREHLKQILNDPKCIEYRGAAELMGHTYYSSKNHAEALKYYEEALEYSEYHEYKYELFHWMANCYHFLKDYPKARHFHQMFLDNNWEPQRLSKFVEYSRRYVKAKEKKYQE
ncbi:MAG: tetratricopeptide repeat protein [Planctomycetota bacterium]|jgi:hypothetical protein